MSTKTVLIEGGERLEGLLHEGAPTGGAVICHPHPLYDGSMWNDVVGSIEEGFFAAGFSTLRFNFRGVGSSTGRYGEGVGETEDLIAACRFLKGHIAQGGRFVIAGYSFGAWVASLASAKVAEATDLFLVAFPFSSYPAGEIKSFSGRIYLVGGSFDNISPLDDLLALHGELKGEKYLKTISSSHFFEGRAGEITAFILENFGEEIVSPPIGSAEIGVVIPG